MCDGLPLGWSRVSKAQLCSLYTIFRSIVSSSRGVRHQRAFCCYRWGSSLTGVTARQRSCLIDCMRLLSCTVPGSFPGVSLAAAASDPPFLPSQIVLLVLLRYVARSPLVSGPFAGTLLHQAPLRSRLLDSQPEHKSLAGRIPVQVLDMSRAAFFRIRCRRYRDGHNRYIATQSPCHV